MTARLHHILFDVPVIFLFEGDFLMEEKEMIENGMAGKELDELICDIFEILKEIETINKEHLDHNNQNTVK